MRWGNPRSNRSRSSVATTSRDLRTRPASIARALAREPIDHGQRAEASAVDDLVGDEIHAPDVVASRGGPTLFTMDGDVTRRGFRSRDLGTMTLSRLRAIATIGSLRLTGLSAWVLWLVVHPNRSQRGGREFEPPAVHPLTDKPIISSDSLPSRGSGVRARLSSRTLRGSSARVALGDVPRARWLSACARTPTWEGPLESKSLVAALLALTAVACSQGTNPASPSTTAIPSSAGISPASTSAGAPASYEPLLAGVREATAKYHDVTKAIADGYQDPALLAAACLEVPGIGTMGIHAVNMGLLMDQDIDPLRPEVLLYVPKKGGGFKLVGVEYFVPLMPNQDALPVAPSVFGQTFEGPMDGHEPGMPRHYDKHVWAWAPNPDGVFAQFNPRLTCSASGEE
jgi:hypothetical protein